MQEATLQVVGRLVSQGVLGVISVILIYALITVYRAKEKLQQEFTEEIKRLHERHESEMQHLMERHINYAEAWVQSGNQLARNLNAVLDSITRRRG